MDIYCRILQVHTVYMDTTKRGLMYECPYQGEKRYVESHLCRNHLRVEDVPFLCGFKGLTERELLRHAKGFVGHKKMEEELAAKGEKISTKQVWLKKNVINVKVMDKLMRKLNVEDSKKVWETRRKGIKTEYILELGGSKEAGCAEERKETECTVGLGGGKEAGRVEECKEAECVVGRIGTGHEEQKVNDGNVEFQLNPVNLIQVDFPLINHEEEYDLLQDILGEEDFELDVEAKEQTASEEGERKGIDKVLDVLIEMKELMKAQNALMTSLNTGPKKHHGDR